MQVLQHARENPWAVKVYSRGAALIVLLSGHMDMAEMICRHLLAEAMSQIHGTLVNGQIPSSHCSISNLTKVTSITFTTANKAMNSMEVISAYRDNGMGDDSRWYIP